MICSLRFKKDVLILKMLLWILCFWFCFKLYPIQVIISLPSCQLLLLIFLCNFCSLFSYAGGVVVTNLFSLLLTCYWLIYFGYSANYNTRRAFVIILLICSNLRNCLRSVGTVAITTESG